MRDATALALLQQVFADFLRSGDETVPAGLLTQIIPGPVAPLERLRIYQRTTRHAQRSALEAAYPVLRALVGAELFAALAADYIAQPGSRSGDLHTFGEAFGQSVVAEPACEAYPYFGDVAEIEWRLHRAFFAADHAQEHCVDAASIAEADFARVRLVPHPSLTLLACTTPASRIWQAHQPGHAAELDQIDPDAGFEWLTIYRRPEGFCVDRIEPAEFRLLERCIAGATLAVALDGLTGPVPDLAQSLPHWLQAGLLEGLVVDS